MSETEPELTEAELRLLGAVPEWGAADEAEPVDDGRLAAFRAGALDDDDAAALAGRLADDPDARALLVAQAEAARGRDADVMSVARVVAGQRRQSSRRVTVVAGVIMALAAVAALFVGRGPEAPRYMLDGPTGGVAETRGADDGRSTTFVASSTLELFARPAAPVESPPDCRAVVTGADGVDRAVDARFVTVADNGVCRLRAPASALFSSPGAWQISLVLIPAGTAKTGGVPDRDGGSWLSEKIRYGGSEQP